MNISERLEVIARELISAGITLEQANEAFDQKMVDTAISVSRGNVTLASKKLGVHRNTLMNLVPSDRALRMRERRRR
jgi:DNA-binding NtrC family response regulator